ARRRYLASAAPDVYPPNLGTVDGVRDVCSYDVLQSRSRTETMKAAGYNTEWRAFVGPPNLPGVRWYLAGDGVHEIPGATPQPWPENTPPDGIEAGASLSVAALVAAAITIVFKKPGNPATG